MDIDASAAEQMRRWVNDHCSDGFIWPISLQRAQGILRIHAACEPPCPRKLAAREYLDTPESERLP